MILNFCFLDICIQALTKSATLFQYDKSIIVNLLEYVVNFCFDYDQATNHLHSMFRGKGLATALAHILARYSSYGLSGIDVPLRTFLNELRIRRLFSPEVATELVSSTLAVAIQGFSVQHYENFKPQFNVFLHNLHAKVNLSI